MEQNNFEKSIQQKLDELKIQPSGSVWQNVEKRIEKKEQRRWKIFILFFLFLLVLSGGYWLLNFENNKQQSKKNADTFQNNIAESTVNKKDSSLNKPLADKNDTTKIVFKNSKILVTSNTDVVKNKNPYKRKSRKTIFLKKEFLKTQTQNEIASQDETANKKLSVEKHKNLNIQNDLSRQKIDLAKKEDEKINTDIEKSLPDNASQDSVKNLVQIENKSKKTDTGLVGNSKKSTKINPQRKWNLGITFSGGTSLVANNPLGINNNNAFLTSANGIGNGGSQTYYSPSDTKNSFAFTGGVFFEKNIYVKHKISVGINYKYFSTLNNVGSRIDSNKAAYSVSNVMSPVNKYKNNFNYLELPVSLKFQLGNNKSLPVYWQAGVSISQLISSNSLQFNNNSGVYYIDNSLFNKTQIGFSTGFSAMLFSNGKHPISIGPYFYYSASKLANEGLYSKKHFSFIGISTEILFRKK